MSLPLVQEGMSRPKAFAMGALSGLAEPVFGCLVVLGVGLITPYMPWMLAFSAGAMMFVVVEELIPEAHLSKPFQLGNRWRHAGLSHHDGARCCPRLGLQRDATNGRDAMPHGGCEARKKRPHPARQESSPISVSFESGAGTASMACPRNRRVVLRKPWPCAACRLFGLVAVVGARLARGARFSSA